MRDSILDSFARRWAHVNEMTLAFARIVPEAHWESTPHPGFAPFAKQLRHVVCVRGVYNDGLRTERIEFGRKHSFYDGDLTRDGLLAALDRTNDDLLTLLADAPGDIVAPRIDFFGNKVSFADCLSGYVQHEAIHHGQWSLYAAHGGYPTPDLWRLQWGLGASTV